MSDFKSPIEIWTVSETKEMTWLGRTDLLVSVLDMLSYTGRKKGNIAFKILMRRKRPQRKTRARKVSHQRSKKGIEYLFV